MVINGAGFNDGVVNGVKEVTVGKDIDGISYLKIQYENDGKIETREHGSIPKEFEINHPDEYLVSVEGWNDLNSNIKGLKFQTNKKTYDLFGYKFDGYGTQFSLQDKDKKIVGFHGTIDSNLHSLRAYFSPISSSSPSSSPPAAKLDALGGSGGRTFDDGAFDGVKKIIVGKDGRGINFMEIEYEKDGKIVTCQHGMITEKFDVDYPNENIIEVNGSTEFNFNNQTTLITSLQFKTSTGKTSLEFGKKGDTEFKLKGLNGGKLVGFYGRSGTSIDAIGAHFKAVTGEPEKLEAQGCKVWDDGADHDGVAAINFRISRERIENIQFEYVKDGETKKGSFHSVDFRGPISTILINHPDEYIVSVEGWYTSSNNIQKLQFKTNRITYNLSSYSFDEHGRTHFTLHVKDKNIVGFHGVAGSHLTAIGAYVNTPIYSSSSSLTDGGGEDASFNHVRKVTYGKFLSWESIEEFKVDSDDYIISLEVSFGQSHNLVTDIVTNIVFKTFKGKRSKTIRMEYQKDFRLMDGDEKVLAEFRGDFAKIICDLGTYFATTITSAGPSV